jgi:hypothetical protein
MTTHRQPVRALERRPDCALRTAVLLLALAALAPPAWAQTHDNTLLESSGITQKYILELAGTVLNETFNRATMSLQISGAPAGSQYSYLVIAEGFPDAQTRNVFFWNSKHSTMDVSANTLTCTIKPGLSATHDIHFYYLSPELLKRPQFTHKDTMDKQQVLKIARQSEVIAQAGELKLTINASTISGTVWLQGYDRIEKSYVRYSATFTGRRALHLDQQTQRTYR